MTNEHKAGFEEFKVKGANLVDKVRELIESGNARRITIKKGERVYFTFPLTWGVGGAFLAVWMAPILTAIGAIAALASDFSVVVEPREKAPPSRPTHEGGITPAELESQTGSGPEPPVV